MTAILKRPVPGCRGVLVFTHKERAVLDSPSPLIRDLIARVRERYVLGMYWGWFSPNTTPPEYIDFHLGHESSVTFSGERPVRRLDYHSSSFTPAAFRYRPEVPKQWDVMSITRALRAKHTGELLEALALFLEARPKARALVICLAPRELSNKDEPDLVEKYERLLSDEAKQRLSFVYIQGGPARPFNREDIAYFYAASRSFALFSSREGASRSVKEALLCGLPVLAREGLEGGGLDHLSRENSRLFVDASDAATKLAELLDDPNVRQEAIARAVEHLSETHGVPELRRDLTQLLEELGESSPRDFLLHDLSIRLPSHDPRELPREVQHGLTTDLLRPADMARYLKFLVDDRPWADSELTADEQRLLDGTDRKPPRKGKRRPKQPPPADEGAGQAKAPEAAGSRHAARPSVLSKLTRLFGR